MDSTERRYAIILGHNRVDDLRETIQGIIGQVDRVWVHDNASSPPLYDLLKPEFLEVIFLRDSEQPPNLSRYWNVSLNQVHMFHYAYGANVAMPAPAYKVAVLTDDLIIPDGWFDAVSEGMDRTGAAAGCTSGFKDRLTQHILKTHPDSDVANRLFGPAFILRGDANIRADERLRWWYGDTDVDWKARAAGGMVTMPGPYVHNKHPNESTVGVNAEQAGRDREMFKEIWGGVPW